MSNAPVRPAAEPNPSASLWTPAREAEARRLYLEDGLSASQVAAALGCGLTRSAVLGKIYRLGLSKGRVAAAEAGKTGASAPRGENKPAKKTDRRVRLRLLPPPLPPRPLPPLREVTVVSTPCPLHALRPDRCRWPLDDPGFARMDRTLFCAAPADGDVYCPAHRALAGVKPRYRADQLWAQVRRFA